MFSCGTNTVLGTRSYWFEKLDYIDNAIKYEVKFARIQKVIKLEN